MGQREGESHNQEMNQMANMLVVNLGKRSRKAIKRLKAGKGSLLDSVQETLALAQGDLGKEAEGKTILPVVLIYKRKDSRKSKFPSFGRVW